MKKINDIMRYLFRSFLIWTIFVLILLLLYGCSSAENVKPEPPKHVSPKIKTDLWK